MASLTTWQRRAPCVLNACQTGGPRDLPLTVRSSSVCVNAEPKFIQSQFDPFCWWQDGEDWSTVTAPLVHDKISWTGLGSNPDLRHEDQNECVLYIKNQLVPHRELIPYSLEKQTAVCSEIHTKHVSTLCGQNEELLSVKLVVYIVNIAVSR